VATVLSGGDLTSKDFSQTGKKDQGNPWGGHQIKFYMGEKNEGTQKIQASVTGKGEVVLEVGPLKA